MFQKNHLLYQNFTRTKVEYEMNRLYKPKNSFLEDFIAFIGLKTRIFYICKI